MAKIKEVIQSLEKLAPRSYQEDYDNSGLLTAADPEAEAKVLLTLDCTEEVVEEAISSGYNFIVAHHPIIFKGLKSLTGKNYVERTVIKAIKNDIGIYAIHTNLDSVHTGVNRKICELLDLEGLRILSPKSATLKKLVTFVPNENVNEVLSALNEAGAGQIGDYDYCSFQTEGTGTFRPGTQAKPHIGESGELEKVNETKLEMIFPAHAEGRIIEALKTAHPYEEVAYDIFALENKNPEVGSGMIGVLPEALDQEKFLNYLKSHLSLDVIRYRDQFQKKISRVAVCGGSGSFLLGAAIGAQADAFVSSDFKYHEFFESEDRIFVADIGHYESEVHTKDLLYEHLKENFPNIALRLSGVVTNPIKYFK